ncbi:MAG TPA: DUF3006 domain-containing protein [Firmicutes bacterium]|jgi:hypothetical protein|nr:DUF3006 domain-containing protein [Bacillota bacterium]HHT41817.1 DUF3006 domain-containing protein [Bacillota bacterium]
MINCRQSAVIDRIVDGKTAVLLLEEGQKQFTIPVGRLPPGSREGVWLLVRMAEGEFVDAELDLARTEEVRERIKRKRALLLERMKRRTE